MRKPIDLDALERVLGRPPRRYGKGDLRNSLRARWIQRAARATAYVLERNDRRGPRPRKNRDVELLPGDTAAPSPRPRIDENYRAAALRLIGGAR
jgi:hypothetical protein